MTLRLRPLSEEEAKIIKKWSQCLTEAVRRVVRETIIRLANEGQSVPLIAQTLGLSQKMGRRWIKRFAESGFASSSGLPLGKEAHERGMDASHDSRWIPCKTHSVTDRYVQLINLA